MIPLFLWEGNEKADKILIHSYFFHLLRLIIASIFYF